MSNESLISMPITNSLYGTEHPSKRRQVDRPDKSVPFLSPIKDHISRALFDKLRKAVAGGAAS